MTLRIFFEPTMCLMCASTVLAATACANPPAASQTTEQLLLDIAQQSPTMTLLATADFTGDDATVDYTVNGVAAMQPLSGHATAEFTPVDGTFYLTSFTTHVDDFSIVGALGTGTMVDVHDAAVQLASVAAPPVTMTDTGDHQLEASVLPTLTGNATITAFGIAAQYSRTDQPPMPIVAHFDVGDTTVQVELDDQYTIAVDQPVAVVATLVVHFTASIPRADLPN